MRRLTGILLLLHVAHQKLTITSNLRLSSLRARIVTLGMSSNAL